MLRYVSPSNRSDEGLTLETSAFKLFTVANLHFNTKLPVMLSPRRSNTVSLDTHPFIHLSFSLSLVHSYSSFNQLQHILLFIFDFLLHS